MLTAAQATPPAQFSGFSGAKDTLRTMVEVCQGPRGERSMIVRSMTEHIMRHLQPKDYGGEVVAIRNWVTERVRYQNDPLHVELVKDPQRICEEILQHGVGVGDCDDMCALIGTMALQAGRVAQFVAAGFGRPHSYSHVFARVQVPKGPWLVCDPVAGTQERRMLERVKTYEVWSLDEPPDHGPVKVYP